MRPLTAFLLLACAAPLNTASTAYTAAYAAAAAQAQTDTDVARLEDVDACWKVMYASAEVLLSEKAAEPDDVPIELALALAPHQAALKRCGAAMQRAAEALDDTGQP